jgi:large subunit ribosomal protein L5
MNTVQDKRKDLFESLKEKFGLTNVMQTPKIIKVVVSTGVGKANKDSKRLELIENRMARITGQKPSPRPAKKSIAAFKSREGDIVGYQVTLRGAEMRGFIDKLIHVALPRTRDFRGIPRKAMDDMGNYTLGIKEHTVFPETSDEELKDVFGLSVTFVTNTNKKEQAFALFEHLGFPFRSDD